MADLAFAIRSFPTLMPSEHRMTHISAIITCGQESDAAYSEQRPQFNHENLFGLDRKVIFDQLGMDNHSRISRLSRRGFQIFCVAK
jgi:hypothetical protein